MDHLQLTVRPGEAGLTLLEFLAQHLELSRNKAKGLLDQHSVFVNGRRVWMAHHPLRPRDRVEVLQAAPRAARPGRLALALLFEDAHLVVVDKPPGVLSEGPDSVELTLRATLDAPELCAVHRLDRDTSGCLVFARTAAIKAALVPLFREQRIVKVYHVLAGGRVSGAPQAITQPVDGLPATTHLRVLDSNRVASHLLARIETGRTHQIRKHLESIGHPVLGDRTYGAGARVPEELRGIPRQMLHAQRLVFRHPVTAQPVRVAAPLPADFQGCLKRLRLT